MENVAEFMLQGFVNGEKIESVDSSRHEHVEFVADEFLGKDDLVATLRGAFLRRLAVCTGRGIDDDSAVAVLDGRSQDHAGVVEIEPLDCES